MSNPHAFENIYKQISDLLLTIREKTPKPIPVENKSVIEEQLGQVEKTLNLFRQITSEAAKTSGVDAEAVQRSLSNSEEIIDRRSRRIVERANQIKSELENLEKAFAKRASNTKLEKKKAKTEGKKRKKKFKRLGGQGWMPM